MAAPSLEVEMSQTMSPLRQLLSMWYTVVVVLIPLVLLPLPLIINTQEAKCAYVIFVMAALWITEALPMAVTSLLPVVLFPMMGVMPADKVSATYFSDASLLLFGGLAVTIALEEHNLHKRIALFALNIVGTQPRWLLLGTMLVTWFLSMWMNNTATTAMMIPIVQAVLDQVQMAQDTEGREDTELSVFVDDSTGSAKGAEDSASGQLDDSSKDTKGGNARQRRLSVQRLGKAMYLSIAMSANIGGTATLIGTGTNVVFLGLTKTFYQHYETDNPINFTSWMVLAFPLSALLILMAWIWFQILFLRCNGCCSCLFSRNNRDATSNLQKRTTAMLKEEYRKLGSISYAEGTVAILFFWRGRGWGNLFQKDSVSDSTPALLVAVLMFFIPSSLPDILFRQKRGAHLPRKRLEPLLNWKVLHQKIPWSLFLLVGGGFAIAKASQTSGLSQWIGDNLRNLGDLGPWVTLIIICYIVVSATQIMSNVALTTLLVPIVAQMALSMEVSPLFFMVPVAITSSLAFMLPVATAPNAIVFASGTVKVIDMVLSGFMVSALGVPMVVFATYTWGNAFFHLEILPDALKQNISVVAPVNVSIA
ncbi:solute carrier family 13 member 2-like [Pomacea canaliculata]|uniref:solute carrier family 13 member 2-like n=1 Tax=Pomacea canaliculata TaxID=400727 RepID=UPI000D72D79D|nr:solute carrier family 13 member 2-like [Pomacea canaliculata]